ncbi:MAG: DUF4435 domain-containing protein [Tannerella sp.]|jgi:hypothetical protein|nr:DUF4435 domain-containing protein [Tannerella sp.]
MIAERKDAHYRELALYYRNRAKLRRRTAAVHLESDFDRIFWQHVFGHFLPSCRFDYITYSRTVKGNRATGCQTCLKYHRLGCLSKEFFICIDSDYRYLLQEKGMDTDHFIFQTYTYSLENHYCHPSNVERVFPELGLQNTLFDFTSFLKRYSRALYGLFLYHLHSLSRKDGRFLPGGADGFNACLRVACTSPDEDRIVADVQRRADRRLSELQRMYPEVRPEALKEKYGKLGVSAENAYLYFRGHHVLDQTVLRIMAGVRDRLDARRTRTLPGGEHEVRFARGREERMETCLLKEIPFGRYPEIIHIEKDINAFFFN